MLNALIAAFSNATEIIVEKTIMTKEKVRFVALMSFTMFFVFLITSSLFPWLGKVDEKAFRKRIHAGSNRYDLG